MKNHFATQIEGAIREHKEMIASFEKGGAEAVAAAAQAIIRTLKKRRRVYICGNGGSAADAQHIASELVGRFQRRRAALPAIALTTDTSALTSIANDYGYENTFSRQVEALVQEGDMLWAISTSGSSANVIAAARLARRKGAGVLAFTGRPNSMLEEIADICFCTHSQSTARSQEVHQLAYHIICDLVETSFCK
ncbi:MAG TPA: SIS domain-containing protein [Sedimentisphaerales bacterium]|nr:SIS domain-containing protein [Sedimentisphaerales bacterium]